MIIFDLDGTLALCDHRRHFVDPNLNPNLRWVSWNDSKGSHKKYVDPDKNSIWEPDYKAFYKACDQDLPNNPIMNILRMYYYDDYQIQIWSGRCESLKEKTMEWLDCHFGGWAMQDITIRMRPIGDSTPDEKLKLSWLNEIREKGTEIEIVFDDRKKVVDMWRSQGITCCQVAEGNF